LAFDYFASKSKTMKKPILLLAFISCIHFSNAQEYSPFQLNQTSLFRTELSDSGNAFVRSIRLDTIIEYPNRTVGYLNINRDISFDCYLISNQLIDKTYQTFDSIVWLKDSIFVYSSTGKFGIKRNLKVGDRWWTNGYEVEYKGTKLHSFLGITDSVQIIHPTSGVTPDILISKNYGLLNYYVFQSIPLKPMVLAGFESNSKKAGLQKPTFNQIFSQKVGDVIYREQYNYGFDGGISIYKKDSIIDRIESDSNLIFKIERTEYNWWTKSLKTEELSWEYDKRYFNRLLIAKTGSFYRNKRSFLFDVKGRMRLAMSNTDTILKVRVIETSFRSYDDCLLEEALHGGFLNTWSTVNGQDYWYALNGRPPSNENVIGSIINGKSNGETKLPTGQDKSHESLMLDIYPNPAQNTLFLNQTFNSNTQVEVYSTDGKLLIQDDLGSNENSIDVSQLSNGNFIIKLENKNGLWVSNFNLIK
jgi:hypothetical protein